MNPKSIIIAMSRGALSHRKLRQVPKRTQEVEMAMGRDHSVRGSCHCHMSVWKKWSIIFDMVYNVRERKPVTQRMQTQGI